MCRYGMKAEGDKVEEEGHQEEGEKGACGGVIKTHGRLDLAVRVMKYADTRCASVDLQPSTGLLNLSE